MSGHVLASILLLGLVAGAACIAIVPPWWHYDEPGHFEYAWLAAHSSTWPKEGQYNQDMRKQMATSMLRYGWYRIRNFKPNINSSDMIPIGVTQTGDKPGYYFLASLPLRLMGNADITAQYYAARFVSFILFLLIIVVAWYAFGEILPGRNTLRWMPTLFIAVLPAFVDTMVSVNNDVSAVLAASLAIWACLRLIQKGYSVRRLLFLAAALAACYLSKSIALFAFVLAPVALVLAPLRGRYTRPLWAALVLSLVALSALALTGGAPRSWYSPTNSSGMRVVQPRAPLGTYAFRFDDSGPGTTSELVQTIPPATLKLLSGRDATLSFWLWADQATQAGPVFVEFTTRNGAVIDSPQQPLNATIQPTLYPVSFQVPNDVVSGTVNLRQTSHGLPHNSIYLDGIALATGKFVGAPQFSDGQGTQGTWDARAFTNLIRNPSAEAGGLQIRQSVNQRTAPLLSQAGLSLDTTLWMLQDWGGSGWYYRDAVATLFRTFWASLAGDKAVIPGASIDYLLAIVSVAAGVGAVRLLWARRRSLRLDVVGFLAIALLLPWLLALARGSSDFLRGMPLFPWARYAYPGILPTALFLCAGWLELLDRLAVRTKAALGHRDAIFVGFIIGLTIFALLNAIRIFHPSWWDNAVLLILLVCFEAVAAYVYMRLARQPE